MTAERWLKPVARLLAERDGCLLDYEHGEMGEGDERNLHGGYLFEAKGLLMRTGLWAFLVEKEKDTP